jgi:glycine cleavage system H lipoate-binding protein
MAQFKEFNLPDDLYYDRIEHIWARLEDNGVRAGLDAFGVCAAGTVAYVKLSPVGRRVEKGEPLALWRRASTWVRSRRLWAALSPR